VSMGVTIRRIRYCFGHLLGMKEGLILYFSFPDNVGM